MRDYQKELDALREQIARRREDSAVLNRLLEQEDGLRQIAERRLAEWDKEHRDVERMERVSLSSLWASLRGTKEEDLARERAEEHAALLKLQDAERQQEEVQEEIRQRYDRLKETEDCEAQYESLLREKEREYREKDPVLAAKLAKLERKKLDAASQRRELLEARDAGERALEQIRSALEALDSAEGWSTWDVWGGGLISDIMKYQEMDEAHARMEAAQSDLRRYQAELADVAVAASFDLQPDGFTSATDLFFDNIFSDWAVRNGIQNSLDQMVYVEDQVSRIQARLELDLDEVQRTLDILEEEWKNLISNA